MDVIRRDLCIHPHSGRLVQAKAGLKSWKSRTPLLLMDPVRYWPNLARNLLPRFVGPFRITRTIDKGCTTRETMAVTLDLPESWRVHPTFHVSLVKAYVPRGGPGGTFSKLTSNPPPGNYVIVSIYSTT